MVSALSRKLTDIWPHRACSSRYPCCGLSALYSIETTLASVALVTFTIIYNELSAHSSHWLLRNVVNAAGFASFEVGATLVLGMHIDFMDKRDAQNNYLGLHMIHIASDRHTLGRTAVLSTCISAGIFATTIHAQDFKDVHGDHSIGRQTIPIVHPTISRYTIILPMLVWSSALSLVWELDIASTSFFVLLAAFIGIRYLRYTTVPDDQVSFYWYNVRILTIFNAMRPTLTLHRAARFG